jgi:MFS family permease
VTPDDDRAQRLLIPATFITSLGNNIQLIAALLLVRTERTMLAIGWLFIAVAAPQALLSPFFGRPADRFDRRTLWVCCDLASGLAASAPTTTVVYAANLALAVVATLFIPVSAGPIKERVRPAELQRFNANYEIAMQAGMLLSASVGGVRTPQRPPPRRAHRTLGVHVAAHPRRVTGRPATTGTPCGE